VGVGSGKLVAPVAGEPWQETVTDLLERTRLAPPDELALEVNRAVAGWGIDMTLYLVDHEQRVLRPVPEDGKDVGDALPVDGSLAGRAFAATAAFSAGTGDAPRSPLWIPLLDGSERLGVLRIDADGALVDNEEFRFRCNMVAALVGHLVVIKAVYGDHLSRVRRTRRMSAGSELLWRLLPPLTFACHEFAVSAVIEPCYDAGGDGFDYAVDGDTAFAMICDTTGHGLPAGIGTAVALSAVRGPWTRRSPNSSTTPGSPRPS